MFVGLPVLLAFVGDEEPDNSLVHDQQDEPWRDPDAEFGGVSRVRTISGDASHCAHGAQV